jgi:hypothetical protein
VAVTADPNEMRPVLKYKKYKDKASSTRNEDVWGSESIALLFLTSALHGGERSASRLGRFAPGKELQVPIGYEARRASVAVWTLCYREKSLAPTGNRTLAVQLTVVSRLVKCRPYICTELNVIALNGFADETCGEPDGQVLWICPIIQGYWVFGLRPSSGILKNRRTQRFGNWICFRPQVRGQETPTQLGPLERASSDCGRVYWAETFVTFCL